jgi:murein DD-endopeptidase MepM/ murein hydrolase activator NlpD
VIPNRSTISPYGARRAGGERIHAGVDVGAFVGDTVIAMGDGVVLWPVSGFRIGADLEAVAIRHEDADYIYAEIHVDPQNLVPGTKLRAGQRIGKVGRNGDGNAMLHLESWTHDLAPKGFVPWYGGKPAPHGVLDVQARLKGLIDFPKKVA